MKMILLIPYKTSDASTGCGMKVHFPELLWTEN